MPGESPFRTDSSFYTVAQHRLIDKYILRFGVKERKPYTKSEKFKNAVLARQSPKPQRRNFDEMTDSELEELVAGIDL